MKTYTMAAITAIALWALPAQAEPPGNEHYDDGGYFGSSTDSGSGQMSDRDFFGALSDPDQSLYSGRETGGSSGSKSSSQGSAGKGSFGSCGGDNC